MDYNKRKENIQGLKMQKTDIALPNVFRLTSRWTSCGSPSPDTLTGMGLNHVCIFTVCNKGFFCFVLFLKKENIHKQKSGLML